MKKTLLLTGLLLAGLAGVMYATNPKQEAFEGFAIEQVKTELCPRIPLGFAKQCPDAIAQNKAMLQGFIGQNTKVQNYGLFSLYETNVSVRELLPKEATPLLALIPLPPPYELKTVGLFGRFIIYNAREQK
jgi:Domain of unknown function (DUF4359)